MRLARRLLRLAPRRFRDRHARDLERLWSDLQRVGDPRGGGFGIVLDALATVLTLWWDEWRRPRGVAGRARRGLVRRALDRSALDFRAAVRRLRATPGFAALAVATLGLGIGPTVALYSVVDSVLLAPLPYPEPERLTAIWHRTLDGSWERGVVTPGNFRDWRATVPAFEAMTALETQPVLLGDGAEPRSARMVRAAGDFFGTLGVRPFLGRGWAEGEPDVVVVSFELWRSLSADTWRPGSEIVVEGEPRRIVGVMPRGFSFGFQTPADLWAPVDWPEGFRDNRDEYFLRVVGRLAEGETLAGARARLESTMATLRERFPKENEGLGVSVEGLHDALVADSRVLVLAAFGAVALVLLIAGVDLVSLLVARAEERRREIGIRRALGASTLQLLRLALAESAVLAGLGVLVGSFVAVGLARTAPSWLPSGLNDLEIRILDGPALVFAAALAVVATLVLGILPAGIAPGGEALRSRSGSERRGVRGGAAWVAAVVALSMVLVGGTGLLARTTRALANEDPGFDTGNLVVAPVRVLGREAEQRMRTFEDFSERVGRSAGVRAGALALNVPLGGEANSAWLNRPENPPKGSPPWIAYRGVSPGYFETVGVEVVRGRTLEDRDGREGGGVVVNRAAAERFWPDGDPFGESITLGPGEGFFPAARVVGIVDDGRNVELRRESQPMLYFHLARAPFWDSLVLVARTSGDAADLEALRSIAREVDPALVVLGRHEFAELTADQAARPRTLAGLVGGFAGVGLVLAGLGIFGTLRIAVARRTLEIGIRMALGADPGRTTRRVFGRVLGPVAVGVGLGVAGAVVAGHFARELLYGVTAADPATLGVGALVLVAASLLAAWRPVRQAARVDPARVLRGS